MGETENTIEEMRHALNRFEARDVHQALGDVGPDASAGPDGSASIVGSGPLDFGSIEPGVLVYRTESGRVRLRVTSTDIAGGSYDEVEGSEDSIRRLVDALVSLLERRGASEDPA
jgi:hypothetical protein